MVLRWGIDLKGAVQLWSEKRSLSGDDSRFKAAHGWTKGPTRKQRLPWYILAAIAALLKNHEIT